MCHDSGRMICISLDFQIYICDVFSSIYIIVWESFIFCAFIQDIPQGANKHGRINSLDARMYCPWLCLKRKNKTPRYTLLKLKTGCNLRNIRLSHGQTKIVPITNSMSNTWTNKRCKSQTYHPNRGRVKVVKNKPINKSNHHNNSVHRRKFTGNHFAGVVRRRAPLSEHKGFILLCFGDVKRNSPIYLRRGKMIS